MYRTETESNAINRVLKAWGLPSLDQPDVIPHMARLVQDHTHFCELLRACDPPLRREMYEAMRPYLKFPAKPLEEYIIAAKEHAEAAQLPTIEKDGTLKGFSVAEIDVPEFELWVQCSRCEREGFFYGARRVDAIHEMRNAGWAWDEGGMNHICANCLDEIANAVDAPAS